MASSVKANGTQASTPGTEHTLLDTPDLGVYALTVNAINLANGEALDLWIYTKAASGGTYAVAFSEAYVNSQGATLPNNMKQSFHVNAPYGAKFTLKQTGGSTHNFNWFVERLDG